MKGKCGFHRAALAAAVLFSVIVLSLSLLF